MKRNDIETENDIQILVDRFYDYVLEDQLLKPVFDEFMTHSLDEHKQPIYAFWSFLLLNKPGYNRNVMAPHLKLRVNELHFLRWLYYFRRTVYELFEGQIANSAVQKAETIIFTMKYRLLDSSKFKIGV